MNNFQIPLWQKMAEQMPPENKEEYIEKIIMKMEAQKHQTYPPNFGESGSRIDNRWQNK